MKPLFCLLGVFFVTIFLSFYNVSAEQESPEKAYAEALVNLTTIEPYFVGKPIYLNPDEQLKTNLRSKIVRIILNTENYVEGHPHDEMALFTLGKAYCFAYDLDVPGSLKKSMDKFLDVIAINPSNELAHIMQGKNYLDAGMGEKAVIEYSLAIKINPNGQGKYFRAMAFLTTKKHESAILDLEDYIRIHPEDTSARNVLAAINKSGAV